MVLQPLQSDRFVWKWSADGNYSVSSTYRAFFVGSTALCGAKELWRTKAPPKVKLFFWLALHRILWTSDRRKRPGLQDEDVCALCNQEAETIEHLLLGCVFAKQVWFEILRPLQLQSLVPQQEGNLADWWLHQRRRVDADARPIFDTTLLLIAWTIWKERNDRVFGRAANDARTVANAAIREGVDWANAGYSTLQVLLSSWSQSFDAM